MISKNETLLDQFQRELFAEKKQEYLTRRNRKLVWDLFLAAVIMGAAMVFIWYTQDFGARCIVAFFGLIFAITALISARTSWQHPEYRTSEQELVDKATEILKREKDLITRRFRVLEKWETESLFRSGYVSENVVRWRLDNQKESLKINILLTQEIPYSFNVLVEIIGK